MGKKIAAEIGEIQPMLPLEGAAGVEGWDNYPEPVEFSFRKFWKESSVKERLTVLLFPGMIASTAIASFALGIHIESDGVVNRHQDDLRAIGSLAMCRDYVRSVPGQEPKIINVTLIPAQAQEDCGIATQVAAAKERMLYQRGYAPNSDSSYLPTVVDMVAKVQLPREDAITAEMERLRADSKDDSVWSVILNSMGYGFGGFMGGLFASVSTAIGITKVRELRARACQPKQILK